MIGFAVLILSAFSYSAENDQFGGQGFAENDFGFGMEKASYADQEYVASQQLVESMTSAYTWVSENSGAFVQGCRGERDAIQSQIASVIRQSGETSTACARLKSEADSCTPDLYCPSFSEGGLPFPPGMKRYLEKAGYTAESLTFETMNETVIEKVCIAQIDEQKERQAAREEEFLESIKAKIPEFRQKCTEFKQNLKQMQERSFDFHFPEFNVQQQGQGNREPQQGYGGQQPGYRDECSSQPPQCPGGARSSCTTGRWVCEQPPYQQGSEPAPQPQENYPMPVQDAPYEDSAPQQEETPSENPQPQETVAPPQEPAPAPEPEQAPAQDSPAETAAKRIMERIFPATGFFTVGNLEEADSTQSSPGSSTEVQRSEQSSTDVLPSAGSSYVPGSGTEGPDFGQQPYGSGQQPRGFEGQGYQPYPGQQYGPNQGQPNYGQQQGYQRPDQQNYGQPPQQGGYGPPGPSPEEMCEMSDDELLDQFAPQQGGPPAGEFERMKVRCKQEASRAIGDLGSVKLRMAMCRAEAAVNCSAKQDAASSCQSSIENPEELASQVVSQMCRRFGVIKADKIATDNFQGALARLFDDDPALANQLGDTVEKTAEDQEKLGFMSYLFGDGDYGAKVRVRADKLKEIRTKLEASGVDDKETLAALDEQSRQLEEESSKFSDLFNMGRLGGLFGGK